MNKDFGDLPGDLEFALLQKSMTQYCHDDPTNYMCYNGTGKWLKPDSNDQVYMRFDVEVNGMYGPCELPKLLSPCVAIHVTPIEKCLQFLHGRRPEV